MQPNLFVIGNAARNEERKRKKKRRSNHPGTFMTTIDSIRAICADLVRSREMGEAGSEKEKKKGKEKKKKQLMLRKIDRLSPIRYHC